MKQKVRHIDRSTPYRPGLIALVLLVLVALMPATARAVTYSTPKTFAAGTEPNAVAIAKLNSDSYFDLVAVNETSHNVSVLLGGPGGTFGTPSSFAVGNLPDAVTVTRLNGDSHLDLVVANQASDDVSVLLGAGNGSFTTAPRTQINDIDGITEADTTITVNSTAGFPTSGLIRIDAEVIHCSAKTAITFSGCTRGFAGTVAAVHANGATVTVTPAGDGPTAVAVGDFNGDVDSYPDIAVTNENSNTISMLFGGPGGGFVDMKSIPVGVAPQSIVTSDFNGDSKVDFVLANEAPHTTRGSVMVLLGAGDGTFSTSANIAYGPRRPTAVEVSDFNGDSKPDFAVANYASNDFSVWLGIGDGTFSATTNPALAPGSQPVAITVGDFNRDSTPDLTIANEGTNDISVLIGAGNGSFSGIPSLPLAPGSGPQSVAVGNLDGDPFPDLAVANKVRDVLAVLFATAPDTAISSGPNSLTNDSTPTFGLSSNDPSSTFQCRVDGAAFASCTSPHTTSTLSDGSHTFQVRAVNDAGHTDSTPASWSFTIDTVPPAIPTMTDTVPHSPANDNNPRVRGTASALTTVALYTTLDCSGAPVASGSAADFNSIGIPVSVRDDTSTEFYATAMDEAGNVSGCPVEPVIYVEVSPPPPPDPGPPPGGGVPPGPGGPSGGVPGGSPITVDVTAPLMTLAGKTVKLKRNGSVSLSMSCPASEPGGCSGSISVETAAQVRAVKRKVKLGRSTFRIGGGKSGSVKLRLSKKNRKIVKKLRKVRVLVVINARDQVGNARTTKTILALKA